MNRYRYILQPYNGRDTRFTCPKCNKHNQLARYIDSETGEALANHVGKCNRIDKCGYHYSPKQYFLDSGIKPEITEVFSKKLQSPVKPISYIDTNIFQRTLKNYDKNNLLIYLSSFFDAKEINRLTNMYNIGTSSRWNGGTTIFWEVDNNGFVRTGKLIKYAHDGHRIKGKNNWVHSVLNIESFNLKQCFFGEHLLNQFPDKDIAIVESEKTAIIASIFQPSLIWLASGGAEGINTEKVKPLEGRNVILFPDTSLDSRIYKKWSEKAKLFGFKISDYLERYTSEDQKANGLDIADFLLIKNMTNGPIKARENKLIPKQELQTYNLDERSPYIPYNTPSPIALIDSMIINPPKFTGEELVVKSREFVSSTADKIELVSVSDYGRCDNWKKHKKAKSYCRACLLNCFHEIKINDKLQKRKYTQLEILIMQSSPKRQLINYLLNRTIIMQTITTDQELQKLFDYQSFEFLIETMQKDSIEFYNKIDGKENEWIAMVMLMKGLEHHGSTTSYGFLLRYQFQKISDDFEVGIREIKVPESIDEFLDLFNEVNHNDAFFNMEYYGK